MREYDFDWVDAFTDRPLAGNPCAVYYDAEDIPVDTRLELVRETRLSECAFLVPSEVATFGVRYYLAGREIPFAGHPTVATVASLVSRGLIDLKDRPVGITLEVGAGAMDIRVSGDMRVPHIMMERRAPVFGQVCDAAEVAGIYGLAADLVIDQPQIVSTGAGHCITLLKDCAAIDDAVLDVGRLQAWQKGLSLANAADIETFLVVQQGWDAGDTYARLLLPPPNPPEDPMTGSATTEMAAYLWSKGYLDKPAFVAEQGHAMGRPSTARVEVLGPRDAIKAVRLAGQGVVLMRSRLTLA